MSLIFNLALLIGVGAAFIGLGGPKKVTDTFNTVFNDGIGVGDSIAKGTPVTQGPSNQFSQTTRESTSSRNQEPVIIVNIPNTNIPVGIPASQATSQTIASQSSKQRAQSQRLIEQSAPSNLTQNTSIRGSIKTSGPQIKRDSGFKLEDFERGKVTNKSSRFEQALAKEQDKAEVLFAKLFGNVQNPDFATGGKS